VARGVTIATAANELRMTPPLKRTALTRQQASVSARASNGTVTTCDYSRWGEPLHLTAPAHSVPISSVL
jgi:hypothetical protein